ncbi:MAG: tRNA (adenosine(37)-N6)-threonylcarbamoyltransferase complex ATPase subunit type 1 TsaE [Bacilli bacterium]|nr:tRNA (adenosine(37)-N6)-threonylcarbamoyltransferase complex ATPase subunit type 1 TsaE [Bacilli bacterium]
MEWQIVTKNEQETQEFANYLSNFVYKGLVILLYGDLGAGKTTFTKGLASGLNIKETINSPTFNIVKCYFKGDINLFHIDAYRLENNKQDIGLDEYIYGDGICVIEWPNYIDYLLPKEYLMINIIPLSKNKRKIILTSNDIKNDKIIKEVKKYGA